MGDRIDLDAIRARHELDSSIARLDNMRVRERNIHDDRGVLLAEVDRLTAENAVLRTEADLFEPAWRLCQAIQQQRRAHPHSISKAVDMRVRAVMGALGRAAYAEVGEAANMPIGDDL